MKYLLTCLFALASLAAQAGVPIQQWTTANGARVLFVESHNLPMLDLQMDFAAGSAYSPADKPALASFAHSQLSSGVGKGKQALDENAIDDRLADVGAQATGSVDADRASIRLRVLSAESERAPALALMARVVSEPSYPAATLERERARTIAMLREAATQPGSILEKRFSQKVYGNHPYGRESEEADLKRIKRQDLVDFHRRFYVARNAQITLVGDISRAEAEKIAEGLVAALPAGSAAPALPAAPAPQAATERIAHPASQAHIAIGQAAIRRGDPDQMALTVGNYTLGGGGFNSWLMQEVRDKRGLSYGVSSYFAPQAAEGVFRIGLQTKAEQADEAIQVVRDTLARFLKEGPSAEALAAAKAAMINSFALNLDSNAKLTAQVADIGFYKRPLDSLDTYAARVEAVTLDDVRAAFARHVKPENLVTVVVGGK